MATNEFLESLKDDVSSWLEKEQCNVAEMTCMISTDFEVCQIFNKNSVCGQYNVLTWYNYVEDCFLSGCDDTWYDDNNTPSDHVWIEFLCPNKYNLTWAIQRDPLSFFKVPDPMFSIY